MAGQATQLAALFNAKFAAGFVGPARYRVDLTTPVGQSTVGGKQALQHVRLVPVGGGPGHRHRQRRQPLVQMTARAAHLFRPIAEVHAAAVRRRARPGRRSTPTASWCGARAAFLRRAKSFAVVMVDLTETPMSDRPPPPRPAAGSQTAWIIAGMALSLALGMGVLTALVLRASPKAPPPPRFPRRFPGPFAVLIAPRPCDC